ncbi:hypothetical protein [Hamadaea tsunoensis]|uniref:hypothetical protein n=1 Tax=Hamadaea tsunoensis TaxID=53368 RepID=UPI00040CF1E8|nr:hypothetical protein [Hamadaea tsunoensis]
MRPDLSLYRQHRAARDVTLEGVTVPGLCATYHSRPEQSRVATVGVYRFAEAEVFMSWGYADEAHCRWTAYHQDGVWGEPREGCPDVPYVLSLVRQRAG